MCLFSPHQYLQIISNSICIRGSNADGFNFCKVTISLVLTFDYDDSSCADNSSRDLILHFLFRSTHRFPLPCTFAETISSQRLSSMQLLARHSSRNLLALVPPNFPRFHCGHIRRKYLAPLARKIKPTNSSLRYLEFSSSQYCSSLQIGAHHGRQLRSLARRSC